MSLYNKIFGVNPLQDQLAKLIDLDLATVPRYRDIYVDSDDDIIVFARLGGQNRKIFANAIAALRTHPLHLCDRDDPLEDTYMHFVFRPKCANDQEVARALFAIQGEYDPMGMFQQMLKDMEAGIDNKVTRRANEVGKEIMTQLERAAKGDGAAAVGIFDEDTPEGIKPIVKVVTI